MQATPLAAWLGGPIVYPAVNVAHVVGVALLFGAIAVLDLRLMGVWRGAPLAAIARPCERVAAVGFALASLSGAALLVAQAEDYVANPLLAAKLVVIGLAVMNLAVLHRSAALTRGVDGPRLAWAGGLSLGLWLTALTLGRLIAYW